MTGDRSWQPVLYGRTLRADRWWRLRPSSRDVDPEWLTGAVLACADGGDGLAPGPRMLLARRGGTVLAGGAGRAALLSETMNSDGSRPLFCFAGWLSRDPQATVPELATLDEHWTAWAAELYASWMPLDWERHPADLTHPHESPFCRAPWAGTPQPPVPARPPSEGVRTVRGIVVVPAADRELCWSLLARGDSDFAYAASFELTPREFAGPLTHAARTAGAALPLEPGAPAAGSPAPSPDRPRPPHPDDPAASPPPRGPAASPPPRNPADSPPPRNPADSPPPRHPADSPPTRHPGEPTEERSRSPVPEHPGQARAGGWKEKIKGLTSAILGGPDEDAEEEPPTPQPEPRSGAAKDLDYWRRSEAGRPARRPDPNLTDGRSENRE
jgi:hypothetical protein